MAGYTFPLMVIFLTLLFGAVVLVFIISYMRSHRLVIRSADSNRIIGYYWMLEKKDKQDGSIWWQSVLWQKKLKIQEPPDECVDVNRRGKSWVEVWRTSEDEYVFGNGKQLTSQDILTKDGKKLSELLDPFTKVQRQVVVQQFAKAEAMKQNNWVKENIINLTALGLMALIIVMVIVYWGEISQGIIAKDGATGDLLKEAKNLIGDLKGDAQTITGTVGSGVIVQGSEDPPR